MWKKLVAIMMAVCLLLSLVVSTFAAGKIEGSTGKTAVFLGDSLSAGFNMGKGLYAAYNFDICLRQGSSSYPWAYPFQFGELVYGEDDAMDPANKEAVSPEFGDYEVHNNIFNYGLSGAKTADINAILHGKKPTGDELNMLQQGFMWTVETMNQFYNDMRANVGNADLVALTIGGNDIYHHFGGFQGLDESTLGQIFYWLSQGLQYEMHFSQLLPLIEQILPTLLPGGTNLSVTTAKAAPNVTTKANATLGDAAGTAAGMEAAAAMVPALISSVQELLDYYSGENVYQYFTDENTSILQQWKEDYRGCVEGIQALQASASNLNGQIANGQIALISLFNPFGIKNYIQSLRVRLESEEFQAALKAESTTAVRVVKSLVDALDLAEKAKTANQWEKMVINALLDALKEVETIITRDHYDGFFYNYYNWWTGEYIGVTSKADFIKKYPEAITISTSRSGTDWIYPDQASENKEYYVYVGGTRLSGWRYTANSLSSYTIAEGGNSDLYDLLGELSFPLMAYMVGNGLQPLYDEMNSFIKSIADENPLDNIVYIDISDAPSNGRFDPHPHEMGHEWIAKSIYEQLCLINGGTAFRGYRGEGEDSSNINLTRVTIRSIKTVVKALTDLVNGDGEAGVKGELAAAITIVQQAQRLSSLLLKRLLF